jgi:hypothetical protein
MKQHRDILRLNFILMNAPMSNDWFQVLGHQNLTISNTSINLLNSLYYVRDTRPSDSLVCISVSIKTNCDLSIMSWALGMI